MFVIQRNDGEFVTYLGQAHGALRFYITKLQDARRFGTAEEAEREVCCHEEKRAVGELPLTVVNVQDILRRA